MSNSLVNGAVAKLGAVRIHVNITWFNKLIVSAYKLAGFVILTSILLGLLSYVARAAFFIVNRSWIVPTILSPTDDKIRELSAQLAAELSARDQLAAQRRDLVQRLTHQEQIVAAEEVFQRGFSAAMRAELDSRRAQLARLQALGAAHRSAKAEILRSGEDYAALSRERQEALFAARVIDVDGLVSGSYQRAQIALAGLSLEHSSVNLDSQIADLDRRVKSLRAAFSAPGGGERRAAGPLSYEVLQQKHEYDRSIVEAERARAEKLVTEESIAAIDASLARVDKVIQAIKDSPYLQAVDRDITIAFVPYENLDNIGAGRNVYACRVMFLWCVEVGHIREVLGGEVHGSHPLPSRGMTRGQMVQVDLHDRWSAREAILYVGRPPLLL